MTRPMQIDDLTRIAVPEQPALSPDGTTVAYALRTVDAEGDRNIQQLWLVSATGGDARPVTHGVADSAPAWSPDGRRIAFLRGDTPQVWTIAATGGEPQQLTDLPLGAGTPVWSPDGARIAFAAFVGQESPTAPIVIDRLDYKRDGVGLYGSRRRHLHLVDVATGVTRQVTTGDAMTGDPAWSPDGTRLAFPANWSSDRDLTLRTPVYVIDADDIRAKPRLAALATGSASTVRWTTDDGPLLVIGQAGAPEGHAGLLRVDLDGPAETGAKAGAETRTGDTGAVVDLAGSLDRNVMAGGVAYPGARPQLSADGTTVYFCARNGGVTHLYAVPLAGGTPRAIVSGADQVVSGLSVAGDRAVIALGTADSFGELAAVDLATGTLTLLTSHGADLDDITMFPREERQFTISDGTTVAGWLMRDPKLTGPLPLLLDIHGGPHNAWNSAADEMHPYHQQLVSRGWAVLIVNPRGSDGYGAKFFDGVKENWGAAEAADLLEPVDTLVAEGVADPDRLAIAGYSYGGYMTAWITGRDHRFKAAVAGGVVSDMVSMVGTCEDAHFFGELELGGQWWQKREAYAGMSPLTRVDEVTTPTLLLHGAEDQTCPVTQAEQWFTALREREVPTRMVLYPGSGHGFIITGPPSQRLDFNRRVVEWVERYAGAATPAPAPIDVAHWQARLDDLAARHKVPGAQLGILRVRPDGSDELVTAATGVLNLSTGVRATPDSAFQIGSITKVWTTTVAMQLVDEGLIGLDQPVVEVLPELKLADPEAQAGLTLRHLLTHTSGIDGDFFEDTGRGDDTLEKYVALFPGLAQIHPLGATWTYCNAGFSLVGRIIEVLTGSTWDAALRERLFTPLGLTRTATLPEDILLYGAAVGHEAEGDGDPQPVTTWMLPRSLGPAGLVASTPADALGFARMHLTGGLAPDGTRVLSEESAAAMAAHQTDVPDVYTLGDSWGLGWIRFGWDGHRLIGHDGNTLGQAAFLRLLPEQGLAVALHTNGGHTRDLYEDLYREIFAELAGITMPTPLAPPSEPIEADIAVHAGTYEAESARIEVFEGDDGPRLRTTLKGPIAELVPDPVDEYALVPVIAPDLYALRAPGSEMWTPVTFYALATGERYVHFGARSTPRVE